MIIEEVLMEVEEMIMRLLMMIMIMIIMIEDLLEAAEISIIIDLMIEEGIFVGLYLMIPLINKKIGFC